MVSNVNVVKDFDCSDSDVITYALVKYYSYDVSFIHMYVHTLVRPYEILFLTQAVLFLDTYSIAYITKYSLHRIYMGIFIQFPQVQP